MIHPIKISSSFIYFLCRQNFQIILSFLPFCCLSHSKYIWCSLSVKLINGIAKVFVYFISLFILCPPDFITEIFLRFLQFKSISTFISIMLFLNFIHSFTHSLIHLYLSHFCKVTALSKTISFKTIYSNDDTFLPPPIIGVQYHYSATRWLASDTDMVTQQGSGLTSAIGALGTLQWQGPDPIYNFHPYHHTFHELIE